MFSNVINHMLFPSKVFTAILASIRCVPGMTPGVIFQVFFTGKRFATSSATVRFICRMSFHVPLQSWSVGEYVKTNGARKHTAT